MAIKIYIPPQYAGNLVELDENLTGVADTLISPPGGARWQAVHNLHTEAVNIFAPDFEITFTFPLTGLPKFSISSYS